MARVQILPLPERTIDGYSATPFVLIFDQAEDALDMLDAEFDQIKESTGASAIWVFDGDMEVSPAVVLTEEQQQSILDRL